MSTPLAVAAVSDDEPPVADRVSGPAVQPVRERRRTVRRTPTVASW
jgi:hypothetical protein